MTILATIGVLGGMTGATLVALDKAKAANAVWLCTNPALIVHNLLVGETEQMWMYVYYIIVAASGLILMRYKNDRKKTGLCETT